MQTQLEIKGITKRAKDSTINSTKTYGVKDNEVKGHNINDQYDINGEDARKGGDEKGSLVDHINKLDMSTGGDKVDQAARNRQLSYAIPGIAHYTFDSAYADADAGQAVDTNYTKIDTSLNIGQVVIY
jgi:hypothetical protein